MTIGTRTFLELRVGRSHTVSVLLLLRRKDVEWFHSNPEHKEELFRIISQHILPNECATEIESYHKYRTGPPTPPVEAGEKNKSNRGGKKGGKKRKGGPEQPPEKLEKPKRSVRNVFGDGLQVTYRVEDATDEKGATLIFPKKANDTTSESSKAPAVAPKKFRQLPRLSKRIILWCYPGREGEDSIDEGGGGFPRPEMIPITSLFRAPPEGKGSI